MINEIIFTDTLGVSDIYKPQPAFKIIPDWYKNTESYIGIEKKPDKSGNTTATIKRCMPVFDAISSGYILVTHTDLYVSKEKIEYADKEYFEKTGKTKMLTPAQIKKGKFPLTEDVYTWPSFSPIGFHPIEQAALYPKLTGSPIPKWINPWGIKTPKGYSTLFVAPFHRDNIISALPGIVDTDKYSAPVNIVFNLSDPNFQGLIPAGTPIVQIIPFKREKWQMSIGKEKEVQEQLRVTQKLSSKFFDRYKDMFRSIKEYK